MLVKGIITVVGKEADTAPIAADRNDKELVFRKCAPFIDCISKINNNAEDLDIVMSMYSLLE